MAQLQRGLAVYIIMSTKIRGLKIVLVKTPSGVSTGTDSSWNLSWTESSIHVETPIRVSTRTI